MNKSRVNLFLTGLALIFLFFFLRLIQLQILENRNMSKLADENAARITPILAPRGIIFDRRGKVVLKNRPVFAVYILPHLLPKSPEDQEKVFFNLAGILNKSAKEVESTYKEKKTTLFEGILIASEVAPAAVTRIEEERSGLPGVELICYPMRTYPYKEALAHVLGYVGEIEPLELKTLQGYRMGDLIGKDGVEKSYDRYLRGVSGWKKIEVDARGRPVRTLETVEPRPGNNMKLTVDLDLQLVVEKALGGKEGAVVALNPQTGEILAMASHPAYDANLEWAKISQRSHPFMNRALSTYPPGSTFKVVTLSAALQSGAVNLTEIFNCPGYYKLGSRYAQCWRAGGHGKISVIEGLVWSCDYVFYELGRRLGPDLISEYARAYGLAEKTGVDLPQEKKGFSPTRAWKREALKEDWYEGDSINFGIGQGFLQVTPLQMAMLYSVIATGKTLLPHVVAEVKDSKDKVIYKAEESLLKTSPVSKENLHLIQGALREVVRRGTGVAAFVQGMPAAGKTGTAENPGRAHAWFICYAPVDDPEIVIVSFVAHGEHGDRVSAYIVRDILKWYKDNRLGRLITEEARPAQYIEHGAYKEYYNRIILDSN